MEATPDRLRIVDANLNRASEGLRVLEEFARLSLNHPGLTQQFKDLRHGILQIDSELQQRLIGARDASGDVGVGMKAAGQDRSGDAAGTIIANARRAQESLRVLEEIAREPGLKLKSADYEKARFGLYTLEKELLARMLRKDKIKRLTGLYVIVDVEFLKGRSHRDVAAAAIRGGARVIQLRDKTDNRRDFVKKAEDLRRLCLEGGILFIVNDSLEAALAADADGLNVGEADMPAAVARRLLHIDAILGCSANTLAEARAARNAGADYLGVGAVFPTPTKDSPATGLEIIKKIKKIVNLPVVAIGGINKTNVKSVMEAGADAVAVISAVMGPEDTERAARELTEIIEGERR
ncbi:MAG: thiamine-phosphate diphosphorylase [Chloroflexi bacterium RBG_13_57_8]|nr:MAG: thiamine-phosphate diphosphorylase [Chloroflexi bacterium RBG_13_57_8]